MRKLTISRTKSFVACLATVNIYIEDASLRELEINGVWCRKLGSLKNGEVKTFEIGDEEAKVFAIADKLSKGFCNDFFQLPAGCEDIYVTGRNRYNLATGNAFRFDNNNSSAATANRKKGLIAGIVVLCVAALVGAVIGFFAFSSGFRSFFKGEKTFSDNGMNITLTREFWSKDYEGFTNVYFNKDYTVLALREDFSLDESLRDYTLDEYGKAIIQNSKLTSDLKTKEDLTWFEYVTEVEHDDGSKEDYKYFAFVFRTDSAFWLIHIATPAEFADEREEQVMKWAETVTFE